MWQEADRGSAEMIQRHPSGTSTTKMHWIKINLGRHGRASAETGNIPLRETDGERPSQCRLWLLYKWWQAYLVFGVGCVIFATWISKFLLWGRQKLSKLLYLFVYSAEKWRVADETGERGVEFVVSDKSEIWVEVSLYRYLSLSERRSSTEPSPR